VRNIETLRDAMFKQLEALSNPNLTTEQLEREIDKAHAVSKLGDTIINSGRLELDFMRAMERSTPLTEMFPDNEGKSRYSSEHAAKVAADMRNNWKLSNQLKVNALNEAKTGT
jgi:hypothetical protein